VSAFNSALDAALERERIEWIVLAGYMVILPAPFVARHAPQIVNIHPSLLPLFPGLHPHRQVLEAGATESGCTVHHVEPGAVDSGRVIAQATVPILSTDTEEALAQRILQAEHRLYPATLAQLLR
jgi:phosphoribosylglycinamide formyltransferase-1